MTVKGGADLVSVIMPAYNVAEYIVESIESVLAQTYTNVELLIIDDGSTDETLDLVQRYGDQVRLISQANAGAAAARNNGAENAKGEWLAFLDSDDIWEADKLERQMGLVDRFEWSCTDSYFFGHNHDGSVRSSDVSPHTSGEVLPTLVINNFIGTSTVLIRRAVFLEFGGFDRSLKALEDWDLWVKVAAKYPLGYIADPVVRYRVHAKSTSRSTRTTHGYYIEVTERMFKAGGPAAHLQSLRKRSLAESYEVLSIISEDMGDYSFAFKCGLKSAIFDPTTPYKWKSVLRVCVKWFTSLFRNS